MKTFYKRKLPHYIPEGGVFFITSRLAGSLPISVIKKLMEQKEQREKFCSGIKDLKVRRQKYIENQKFYFFEFDSALNKLSNGPYWLQNSDLARIVAEALHYRDGKVYDLYAYSIMSNHIHIVIKPIVRQHAMLSKGNSRIKDDIANNVEHQNGQLDKLSYKSSDVPDIGRKKQSPYILGDIMESLKGYTAFECNKVLKRKGKFWHHENYDHVVRNQEELIRIIKYTLNNPVKAGLCQEQEKWEWNYYNSELIGL